MQVFFFFPFLGWADIIHMEQARISGDSVIMKEAIVVPILDLYPADTR